MESFATQEKINSVEEMATRETKTEEAERFVSEMFADRLGETLEKIKGNPYFFDLSERRN
jgi:hypothetical protein